MDDIDQKTLSEAVQIMENTPFLVKMASKIGTPVVKLGAQLPEETIKKISDIAEKAIYQALKVSIKSLGLTDDQDNMKSPSKGAHIGAVVVAGATAGFFGLTGMLIELPITTTIMMRSIAEIARSESADLSDQMVQLECLQVLSLGGISGDDDNAEIGYFAAREAMAQAVKHAGAHIATNGIQREGAPAIAKFILQIAERFSITVTEKAALQALPLIGAAGGAIINTVFMDHFQDIAKAHFSIRRLENKYGAEPVKEKYCEIQTFIREKNPRFKIKEDTKTQPQFD